MWPESDENNRPLRSGLTTGSCATACCVAAAKQLLANETLKQVTITLPRGKRVELDIDTNRIEGDVAYASTVKDAGDDPDVTHGALVQVWLALDSEAEQGQITFKAGEGVGTVTRPGLVIGVGEPAINPVPRTMIRSNLERVAKQCGYEHGFIVTVGVQGGRQLADKTMNPRLGILGGLSILGTTGIVRPFSCAAYIASIHQGIDVAKANGISQLAATTGSTSEGFIQSQYNLPEMALIEMGDFVGAVLKYVRHHPIEKLSLCGGFGKMTKLAAGHMDLHSSASSIDFDALAECAIEQGADDELAEKVRSANTSIEALKYCQASDVALAEAICERAAAFARSKISANTQLEVWAVDRAGKLVGRTEAKPGVHP